jgi:CubicO group peptidase (beta-lactamase class C family)
MQLDTYFSCVFDADETGGAITVIRHDSVLFESGYGLADLTTKEPITPNTLFNLGSVSKTFVANAILLLEEKGMLSSEDHLLKYFPGFKNKYLAEKVKIKHLLTHTSGLPDCREVAKNPVFYLTAKDAENWYPITQNDNLVFEPGTDYEYSNPAFNGLALIVEQVAGMKWQDFIVERIMRPSGMMTSTITDGPHPESGVAHGYVPNDGKWMELDYGEEPTFPAAGNGGVWSSIRELVNYEQAIQKSIFLNAETIKASRTIKEFENWNGKISPFIGWSWFIGQSPKGLKTVGHTGSQGGFLCNYVTVPEKNIHFVILCNTPLDVDAMTAKIFEYLDL